MIAVDHLTAAVMAELSSRYCPTNTSHFLLMLLVAVVVFFGLGIGLIATALRWNESTRRLIAYTAAAVVIFFALGGAAWDLFGFFGCGGYTTPGLVWDWPW